MEECQRGQREDPAAQLEQRGRGAGDDQDQEGVGGDQVAFADLDAAHARRDESHEREREREGHRGIGPAPQPDAGPERDRQGEQEAGRVLDQEGDGLVVPPAGLAACAEQVARVSAAVVLRLEAHAVQVRGRQDVGRVDRVQHPCRHASGPRPAQQLVGPRRVVEAVRRPEHERHDDHGDGEQAQGREAERTSAAPIAQRHEQRAQEYRHEGPGRDAGGGRQAEGARGEERAREPGHPQPAPEGPGGEDEERARGDVDRGQVAMGHERGMEGREQRRGQPRDRAGHGAGPGREQSREGEHQQRGGQPRAPEQAAGAVALVHELPAPGEDALRGELWHVEGQPQQAEPGERLRERGMRRIQPVVGKRELPVSRRDVDHLVVRHPVRGDAPRQLQGERAEQDAQESCFDCGAAFHREERGRRVTPLAGGRAHERRRSIADGRNDRHAGAPGREPRDSGVGRAPAPMAYCCTACGVARSARP